MIEGIKIGERVVVSENGRRRSDWPGIVVWTGRVWMQVVRAEDHGDLRALRRKFRFDTQTDGSTIGAPSRFYTLAQYAEKQRRDEALTFLKGQGVRLDYDSPWRRKEALLAEIIGPHARQTKP